MERPFPLSQKTEERTEPEFGADPSLKVDEWAVSKGMLNSASDFERLLSVVQITRATGFSQRLMTIFSERRIHLAFGKLRLLLSRKQRQMAAGEWFSLQGSAPALPKTLEGTATAVPKFLCGQAGA